MPHSLPSPCRYPGCPKLSHERFCPEHQRQTQRAYDAARGSVRERGYDGRWQQLRKDILKRDPVCRWPDGCTSPSTDVDHVVSKRRGGTDDPLNLRGLCHSHHSMKTAHEDGRWGGAA
jgi:5-methylcytosine-specific restriction protein A